MKVIYLYHSGFVVELYDVVLIFDYYKGELPQYQKDKKIYVFVSHKHGDHFNLDIFRWCDQYENIHFFLGSDVRLSDSYLERKGIDRSVKDKITHTGKHKIYRYEELTIETLRSTDAGVAFLVGIGDKLLYHAGDLNWWRWEGEAASFNEKMERDYKSEIDSIRGRHFCAAFVPLDPRQEADFALGMDYFRQNVSCDLIFPMHMWDRYDWIETYKKGQGEEQKSGRVIEIKHPGEEFETWNI